MAQIKVKAEHKDKVFGFNHSVKPLGERDDLHLLIKDAKRHNSQYILDMFEEIPDDNELLEAKGKSFLTKKQLTSGTGKGSKSTATGADNKG